MKYYYTLWKGHDGTDEAVLLEDEAVFRTRRNCFKRARQLTNKLVAGSGFFILVRKVSLHSFDCIEWKFEAIA